MTRDVTAVIPFLRSGNREWLQQAVNSLGLPVLVAENDGEMAEALNQAIQQATTEWVLVFGADDVALPGFVDELLAQAHRADVVYPTLVRVNADLSEVLSNHPAEPFCPERLRSGNYISGCALIRRTSLLAAGGYRQLPALEDWELWLRMMGAGARFKPAEHARIAYRQHGGNRNTFVDDDDYQRKRLALARPRPVKATFYCGATPATTYLRCQLPARHLPAVVLPGVTAASNGEEVRFPDHRGDAAVMQFASDKGTALVAVHMRDQGVRTVVEVDDNYLIHPGKRLMTRMGWGEKIGSAAHTTEGHRLIVRDADAVTVTTELLAKQYRKVNPNVFVVPNTVDPDDWAPPAKPDDGIFRIAWVASLSHQADIPLVTKAFEWASSQKDVRVYSMGIDPGWKFPHGKLPWMADLDAYRDAFSYFDVGVAPIKPNPFGLGRSDVKALEYAMGLAAPVLSDVDPYQEWDDTRCIKAKDSKGFLAAIRHLVTHREEARMLAEAAREHVMRHRTTQAQIHLWEEAVAS
jgi:hypothetical protein